MRFSLLVAAVVFIAQLPLAADSATVYVNNLTGNDANDGSADHPCATIQQGLKLVGVSGRVNIANTGKDYRESVRVEGLSKGRPSAPLVIEGNGAVLSGLMVVPADQWTPYKDDIVYFNNTTPDATGKLPPMPGSDFMTKYQPQGGYYSQWQAPKIFFLDGKAAPVVYAIADIPPGGFFYDTLYTHHLYFRLPTGRTLADCKIEFPRHSGMYVGNDYTVVRNMISRYSYDDGFDGFWGIGVVFENCQGSYNCDQGISFHGTSDTIIDGGLYEHNGGAGIVDVGASFSLYRSVVVRNNMSYGAYFTGLAHCLISCRFYGNFGSQIASSVGTGGLVPRLSLRNCLFNGAPPAEMPSAGAAAGVVMERGYLDHCTIVNCTTGLQVIKDANVSNCVFDHCNANLIYVPSEALPDFSLDRCWLNSGTVTLGAQKIDATGWADATKMLKCVSQVIWKDFALKPPLFVVPDNSSDAKAADYGSRPGAELPPWEAWRLEPVVLGGDYPHP